MRLLRVLPIAVACCIIAPGTWAAQSTNDTTPKPPAESRVWKVSDSAGLVAAVKEMHAEGGMITLAPGKYEITETLVFRDKSQVNIEGSGWSTVIHRRGDGDAILFDGGSYCRVHNLTVEGEATAKKGSGIIIRRGGLNTIDLCHINMFAESGVRWEGTDKEAISSNTLSNCWLTNNLGDQLYSFQSGDFYVTGNQFGTGPGRTPRSGAWLDHSGAGTYSMNYHWSNVVALRLGPGSYFNRIENNRFEMSREMGILIGDPKGGDPSRLNIITGNTIHTNGEFSVGKYNAVEAYGAMDTTFCQNQVFSWNSAQTKHKSALFLGAGCLRWIVKDNILCHSADKPIVYDKKAGHIVKDNGIVD